jgi:hypothetical protein
MKARSYEVLRIKDLGLMLFRLNTSLTSKEIDIG